MNSEFGFKFNHSSIHNVGELEGVRKAKVAVARGTARRPAGVVQRHRDRQDEGRAGLPRRPARERAQVHLLRASPGQVLSLIHVGLVTVFIGKCYHLLTWSSVHELSTYEGAI